MRQINFDALSGNDRVVIMSEEEIALIHALTFYCHDGMTREAKTINNRLERQTRKNFPAKEFSVWE
jgi:hypothetical protein